MDRYNDYRGSSAPLADLQDTGVSNGRMMPGQLAKLGAWGILAVILLLPIAL